VLTKHEDRFRLKADAVKAAITPKTKAILIAFPTNPTGAIMEQSDLEEIAELVRGTDIIVVTDEIYAELTFNASAMFRLPRCPACASARSCQRFFPRRFP
jgi:aminotransferase